jgi:glycosyltransferase involved in cell wall biosynthesis
MPPSPRRRLLFLNWRDLSHPQGGGSERYVEQLAEWLSAAGDEVMIHCAAHPGAPASELREGVRIYRRGGRATVYVHGLRAVRRLRPDVVVDVGNGLPFFSPLVHDRVVLLIHHVSRETWSASFGPLVSRVGWFIESRVVRHAYRRARYVAVSGPTREDVIALGVAPDRVSVVHNAADPEPARASGTPPVRRSPAPTLCVVARLVAHKQVDHAVQVLALLVEDFPGLRLRVVGDGPARDHVRSRAAALGVADRVEMLGWVDEATKHDTIASSWVLLCPSVKEGWGRVVMEAAAHQVPTVAYRSSGGLRESVRDGETGLLADDVRDMAERARSLLRDPVRREAMGAAAREYAASFTSGRMVAEFRRALAEAEVGTRAG